jgi:hypothetical protein
MCRSDRSAALSIAILAVRVDPGSQQDLNHELGLSILGQVTLSEVRRVRFRASSGWMSRLATFTMP